MSQYEHANADNVALTSESQIDNWVTHHLLNSLHFYLTFHRANPVTHRY